MMCESMLVGFHDMRPRKWVFTCLPSLPSFPLSVNVVLRSTGFAASFVGLNPGRAPQEIREQEQSSPASLQSWRRSLCSPVMFLGLHILQG